MSIPAAFLIYLLLMVFVALVFGRAITVADRAEARCCPYDKADASPTRLETHP